MEALEGLASVEEKAQDEGAVLNVSGSRNPEEARRVRRRGEGLRHIRATAQLEPLGRRSIHDDTLHRRTADYPALHRKRVLPRKRVRMLQVGPPSRALGLRHGKNDTLPRPLRSSQPLMPAGPAAERARDAEEPRLYEGRWVHGPRTRAPEARVDNRQSDHPLGQLALPRAPPARPLAQGRTPPRPIARSASEDPLVP